MQVLVRDNNVEQALKVLKKKMQREGVFKEMKQQRSYEKPSERRTREKAEAIFKILGLPFTKHTNAWVPFVLASISLLKPGGRLGMILPSEIVHVAHAQSLRTYLGTECSRLLIIDPEEIWFDGTLQGAVILFAEKKRIPSDHSDGLGIIRVSGRDFLNDTPGDLFNDTARMNGKTVEGKRTRALLTIGGRGLLDRLIERSDVHRFDEIAKVDVGIVAGANKFFLEGRLLLLTMLSCANNPQ